MKFSSFSSFQVATGLGILIGLGGGISLFQGDTPMCVWQNLATYSGMMSTGFSLLVVLVITLFASMIGHVANEVMLNVASYLGRESIYRRFNSSLPDKIKEHLINLSELYMSADPNFKYNDNHRLFITLQLDFAARNWSQYIYLEQYHSDRLNQRKSIASIIIFGGIPFLILWTLGILMGHLEILNSDVWSSLMAMFISTLVTLSVLAWVIKLYLSGLLKEFKQFYTHYTVLLNYDGSFGADMLSSNEKDGPR